MKEPSVLDYLQSKLFPKKYPPVRFEPDDSQGNANESLASGFDLEPSQGAPGISASPEPPNPLLGPGAGQSLPPAYIHWPFFSLGALFLALVAQTSLGPTINRDWKTGLILMMAALACVILAFKRGEWHLQDAPAAAPGVDPTTIHLKDLAPGLVLMVVSFFSFGNLKLTTANLSILLAALIFLLRAFWVPGPRRSHKRISAAHVSESIEFHLSKQQLLKAGAVVVALLLVSFFRFYQLEQTPPEMNSDHAEKILDISRVLEGQTAIFFPNNGGREGLQMYMVAGLHRYFGVPLGFTALKLVTALVGFLALPFIYLLGKEIGSERIGFLALLFAGVAYWPNVVARVGLRLPFYILFTASTMYFLMRGLRRGARNEFILAGISLGLSFYGYSADRVLPVLILLAFGLFFVHSRAKEKRAHLVLSLLVVVLFSFVVFIPLLRYIIDQPDNFLFRTLTRMGSLEQPINTSPISILISNYGRALAMFSWSAGVVWPVSIPNSPALGVVPGALFYLGAALIVLRYLRQRHWQDIFLLLAIPVLLLPSVLALAFPSENPNLYRTGGAVVPVFLIIAVALDGLISSIIRQVNFHWAKWAAWGLAGLLFAASAAQDYDLVFRQYAQQYSLSSWNSSEMGKVAREFMDLYDIQENVFVMGVAHWVDTRLVAIQAGFPTRDFALFIDQIPETETDPRTKLFIIRPDDEEAIRALLQAYPNGWFQLYDSKVETKDFYLFFVPPQINP